VFQYGQSQSEQQFLQRTKKSELCAATQAHCKPFHGERYKIFPFNPSSTSIEDNSSMIDCQSY
jgi:hypothetical protein